MQEKAGVGVETSSQMIQAMCDLLDFGLRSDHHTCNDVRVTIQIFGRAVEFDVKADVQGPEVDGRTEGAVYQ